MYKLERNSDIKTEPLEGFLKVNHIKSNKNESSSSKKKIANKGILKKGVNFCKPANRSTNAKTENINKEPKRKPAVKKNSYVKLIEKLKQIELQPLPKYANFLKSTDEELNVAAIQLEEINRLLRTKIMEETKREQEDQRQLIYINRCTYPSKHNCKTKDHKSVKFANMQEEYFNKPKVHYRSLNDLAKMRKSNHSSSTFSETTDLDNDKNKAPTELNTILQEDYIPDKQPKIEVLYNINKTVKENESEMNVMSQKNSTMKNSVKKSNPDLKKKNLYELVFEDSDVETSILKSQYLLKEFSKCIDTNDKNSSSSEEKSVQLFKNALHNFRDRHNRQENSDVHKRERKLFSALNLALKNSLYTTATSREVKI